MLRRIKAYRRHTTIFQGIYRTFASGDIIKPGDKPEPKLTQQGIGTDVAKGDLPPEQVYVLPRPKYGGRHAITLLTGSTLIGKMGAKFITSLLSTARVPVEIEHIDVKNKDEYFKSVLRNRAAVHIDLQHDASEKQKVMKMANDLDLFVSLVKLRSFPGFQCRFPDLNIVLIGQNNMGDFSKLEYSPVPGIVESLRVVTDESITRFLTFVFAYARNAKRKRITVAHKISESPKSDGRFTDIAKLIQKEKFTDIELELMDIDQLITHLVHNPTRFDVVCANDRYCTVLTTMGSAVAGSANLFSAIELGDYHAIFKPLQTKLSLTGFHTLSPYGIVSTCVDLLEYLGNKECGERLWNEMLRTMKDGIKTPYYGGTDSGEYIICNIMNRLNCQSFGSSKANHQ